MLWSPAPLLPTLQGRRGPEAGAQGHRVFSGVSGQRPGSDHGFAPGYTPSVLTGKGVPVLHHGGLSHPPGGGCRPGPRSQLGGRPSCSEGGVRVGTHVGWLRARFKCAQHPARGPPLLPPSAGPLREGPQASWGPAFQPKPRRPGASLGPQAGPESLTAVALGLADGGGRGASQRPAARPGRPGGRPREELRPGPDTCGERRLVARARLRPVTPPSGARARPGQRACGPREEGPGPAPAPRPPPGSPGALTRAEQPGQGRAGRHGADAAGGHGRARGSRSGASFRRGPRRRRTAACRPGGATARPAVSAPGAPPAAPPRPGRPRRPPGSERARRPGAARAGASAGPAGHVPSPCPLFQSPRPDSGDSAEGGPLAPQLAPSLHKVRRPRRPTSRPRGNPPGDGDPPRVRPVQYNVSLSKIVFNF